MIPASTRALVLSLPEPVRRALAEVPGPGWHVTAAGASPGFRPNYRYALGYGWLPASEAEILDAVAALMGEGWTWRLMRGRAGGCDARLISPGLFTPTPQPDAPEGDGLTALDAALAVFAAAHAAKEGR